MSHRNDREPGDGHARQNIHARGHTHTAAVHIAQFRLSQAALPRIETASRTAVRVSLGVTIGDVSGSPPGRQLCSVEPMPHRPVERPVTVVYVTPSS